ncbi:histidine-rich glycoprotein-like [Anopheles bellator]|uniref:histidine-rich glycoprotein-like n=1 Tax=Anopheles bellator TaxID=139047 RepID=UPI002649481E|nr:histidine-rich glycoprotein-like [Anopheles bellator]
MQRIVVAILLSLSGLVLGAPTERLTRSSDEGTASSYFYFSRSPGHSLELGAPGLTGVPHLLTDAKFFPVVKSVELELESDEELEPDVKAIHGHEDDHEAYRVVEQEEDDGSSHDEDHHSKKGESSSKGYDSKHELEKGSKGSYDKEGHEHRYENGGDRKHSHHDEGSHYKDHHEAAKRTKGGKHHEKKHHKKGSKTTGYHNVYHKDEYKKEHIFYDTSDHTGHFKKYGSAHEHHSDEQGKHGHGGHEDRAHQESSHKNAGGHDRGKYDEHHAEHKHRHGQDQYDRHGSSYEQNHGHQGGGERGYKIIHH